MMTQTLRLKLSRHHPTVCRMSDPLGKLVRARFKALKPALTAHRFGELVKMNTGFISLILNGHQALPDEHIPRWAEVLQWPQGTVEYAAFVEAAKMHRAKRYKKLAGTFNEMEARIAELKQQVDSERMRADANAAVADELRLKVAALGKQIATLRQAVDKLTGGTDT